MALLAGAAVHVSGQGPTASPASGPASTQAEAEVLVTAPALPPSYNAENATSATRLPEPILDTDRSVQVVTLQVIQDRDIIDPQEAVQDVSGVERGGSRTGVGETYFIRGFEQGGLYKDGFRAGELSGGDVFTFEGPTDIANLDRIEVLKGPSAILYGRGEPGGTVNYITRTPDFANSRVRCRRRTNPRLACHSQLRLHRCTRYR